jgi:hypothetical protein
VKSGRVNYRAAAREYRHCNGEPNAPFANCGCRDSKHSNGVTKSINDSISVWRSQSQDGATNDLRNNTQVPRQSQRMSPGRLAFTIPISEHPRMILYFCDSTSPPTICELL